MTISDGDVWDAVLESLGREALVISDSPGFVINRLLHPLINAVAMLVEESVASAEVVDGLLEGGVSTITEGWPLTAEQTITRVTAEAEPVTLMSFWRSEDLKRGFRAMLFHDREQFGTTIVPNCSRSWSAPVMPQAAIDT